MAGRFRSAGETVKSPASPGVKANVTPPEREGPGEGKRAPKVIPNKSRALSPLQASVWGDPTAKATVISARREAPTPPCVPLGRV